MNMIIRPCVMIIHYMAVAAAVIADGAVESSRWGGSMRRSPALGSGTVSTPSGTVAFIEHAEHQLRKRRRVPLAVLDLGDARSLSLVAPPLLVARSPERAPENA